MSIIKSIHNYLCKPMTINTYEYFLAVLVALTISDLLN